MTGFSKTISLWFLCGLYPALLFCSTNWYIFTWRQIGLLFVVIPLGMAAIGCLWTLICYPISRRFPKHTSQMANLLQASAALIFLGILLRTPLSGIPLPMWQTWVSVLLLGSIVLALVYFKGLQSFLIIMTFLNAAGLLHFGYQFWDYTYKEDNLWHTRQKDRFEKIVLKQTPNIYFIIAESYPSRQHLQKNFHIDNSRFYHELERYGFQVNHHFFSNYSYTLASLSSLFAMTHHHLTIAIGKDEAVSAREIITGQRYNSVVDVLRRNGYYVQYLHRSDYQLRKGAGIDFYAPRPSPYRAIDLFLNPVGENNSPDIPASQFQQLFQQRVHHSQTLLRPHFTYIYILKPGHSPHVPNPDTSSEAAEALTAFWRDFPQSLEQANARLIQMIHAILERDKDPIIILCGDHGPWGFRSGYDGYGVLPDAETMALDLFGALMAIRWPFEAGTGKIKEIKSGVNLFRTVFALLSGNTGLLDDPEADDSYYHGKILIRNGQPRLGP